MRIQNGQFPSLNQINDQYFGKQNVQNSSLKENLSFQEILEQAVGQDKKATATLKFSKHASGRLADRQIRLTDEQLARLDEGTKKAGEKGIQESLVLIDELAFIVNIPNHTVITAMAQNETNENVFTNIDGAVIM